VFPARYVLGFIPQKSGILHSHRRENLITYMTAFVAGPGDYIIEPFHPVPGTVAVLKKWSAVRRAEHRLEKWEIRIQSLSRRRTVLVEPLCHFLPNILYNIMPLVPEIDLQKSLIPLHYPYLQVIHAAQQIV
jgi:hypothetical protein